MSPWRCCSRRLCRCRVTPRVDDLGGDIERGEDGGHCLSRLCDGGLGRAGGGPWVDHGSLLEACDGEGDYIVAGAIWPLAGRPKNSLEWVLFLWHV